MTGHPSPIRLLALPGRPAAAGEGWGRVGDNSGTTLIQGATTSFALVEWSVVFLPNLTVWSRL